MNDIATLQFVGLTPGEEYYLFADGIGSDVCSFRLKTIQGVNTGVPDNIASSGTVSDGQILGDNDVCVGETVTYSLIPPTCKLTLPSFNCAPPEGSCGFCGTTFIVDTVTYKWHIPECARFLGDSTGLNVTVIYDQCTFDSDTVVVQQAWIEILYHYSDTSFVQKDTLVFCECYGGGLDCGSIPPMDVSIHYNVELVYLEIPCFGPPPVFMGTPYPSPGTFFKFDAPNCTLYKIIVTQGQNLDLHVIPYDQITCQHIPILSANSPFPVSWQAPWGQQLSNNTPAYSPGIYTATATAPNGCTSTASTLVIMNINIPIANAGPDLFVCAEDQSVQISAQYAPGYYQFFWSNGASGPSITDVHSSGTVTYTVTVTDVTNGCTSTDQVTVTHNPPIITNLGTHKLCPGECFTVGGEQFCAPNAVGQFLVVLSSANGCDSTVKFTCALQLPDTINKGQVATLSCTNPTVTVHGINYSQPGVYTYQANPCTIEKFSIGQDLSPAPTMLQAISICPGECFIFNGQTVCPIPGDAAPSMQLLAGNGCDSIVTQPFVFNKPDTVQMGLVAMLTCAAPSALVHGINYSQPGDYTVNVDPCTVEKFSIGQDMQPPAPTMLQAISICPGECFTFNGQTVCPMPGDATPTLQLQAVNGCDSLVLQPFVFNTPDTVQMGLVATLTCAAPSALVHGINYSQPGDYTVNVDPCTVEKFSIGQDIQPPAPTMLQAINICPGECFTFNGQTVCPMPGDATPTMQLQAGNGCDSMVLQPFVFNTPDTVQMGLVATLTCAAPSALVHGINYSQPGDYTVNVDPCTVEKFSIGQDMQPPAPTMLQTISICPGECFTFNGQTVCPMPGDTTPTMQLQAGNGCDSLVLQPFVFNMPDTVQMGLVATLTCAAPTVLVHGINYSQPGDYTVNVDPCTVEKFSIDQDMQPPAPTMLQAISICPGECFTFNGQTVCPMPGDATPTMQLQASNGCDSLVLQPFVFNKPDTLQMGLVATLTCAAPTVLVHGINYSQPGDYTVNIDPCTVEKFSIGQDMQPPAPTMLQAINICPGECFTFNGQTVCPMPGDATPTMQLQASNGCDSLVLQPFVFNTPDTLQMGQVALLTCAVPTASIHGTSYSQPGTYATKIDPCTYEQFSIAAAMTPALTELPVLQICPGDCIAFDGVSFCPAPGDPPLQKMLQTTTGCDSLVQQPFVLNTPDTLSLGTVATLDCRNASVVLNGITYTQEGVYLRKMDNCAYERFAIEKAPENCLDIYVPNVIQVGQGGENNWFTLYANPESGIKITYLRIYDRWGEMLFQNTDFAPGNPESGWNGQFRGKKCMPGVYVYTYELLMPDGTRKFKSGDLTLVR